MLVIRSLTLKWYGDSLLSCNALSLIVGEWPLLHLVGTMRWAKIDVALVHSFLYGRGYNRDYQLPLISKPSNFGTTIGIWRVFFFLVALGVSLLALIAWWRCDTHHGHVSYFNWLKGLVSGETFRLSCAF